VLHQILLPETREFECVELELEPSARIAYVSILEEHLKNKRAGTGTSKAMTGHLRTQTKKASHWPTTPASNAAPKPARERAPGNSFHGTRSEAKAASRPWYCCKRTQSATLTT
jgi:hypothetical protein